MQRFQQLKTQAERPFHSWGSHLVENVPRDQEGEGASKAFKKYFKNEGIAFKYTAPYTPEQDTVSERLIEKIVGRDDKMMKLKNFL